MNPATKTKPGGICSESATHWPGMKAKKPGQKMQAWIDARKRHHLSHADVQMARELGMNPDKLAKIDNHRQEQWKMPLCQFIQHVYLKTFGKKRPDVVLSIEENIRREDEKKARKREAKSQSTQSGASEPGSPQACDVPLPEPRE